MYDIVAEAHEFVLKVTRTWMEWISLRVYEDWRTGAKSRVRNQGCLFQRSRCTMRDSITYGTDGLLDQWIYDELINCESSWEDRVQYCMKWLPASRQDQRVHRGLKRINDSEKNRELVKFGDSHNNSRKSAQDRHHLLGAQRSTINF